MAKVAPSGERRRGRPKATPPKEEQEEEAAKEASPRKAQQKGQAKAAPSKEAQVRLLPAPCLCCCLFVSCEVY